MIPILCSGVSQKKVETRRTRVFKTKISTSKILNILNYRAFWSFRSHYPKNAENLLQSLDEGIKIHFQLLEMLNDNAKR